MPPKVVKRAPPKKPAAAGRKRANGYQMPSHIPNGEILTDIAKQQWKIGPSIGSGGFGEIYSACKANETSKKTNDYEYVVKIEPHNNGPLFVEMHFYMRNAKLDDIETFRKKRKLKSLGMPNFIGNGSHELDGIKHRFIVMPKFGRDIWSIFLENERKLPLHTAFRLAIQMIDVLEYIHQTTYVHADLKGANMLLGLGKGGNSQAYLVDFGLACHYTTKDYKLDPKKMHNGTIEYTSRDAHNGVPTMRGDMEILAYNLLHWSGQALPWETQNLLTKPVKVQEAKEAFMKSIDKSLEDLYGSKSNCPAAIQHFFKLINNLKYNETPPYEKCRKIFDDGLKSLGKSNTGDLDFKILTTNGTPKKVKGKVTAKKTSRPVSDTEDDEEASQTSPMKRARDPSKSKVFEIIESESDSEKNKKKKRSKRAIPEQNYIESESPEPKKPKSRQLKPGTSKSSSQSTDLVTTSESTPNLIVNNEMSAKGGKKNKTYQFDIELNVSIDSNVVINVKRKDKRKKSSKVSSKTPSSSAISAVNGNTENDSEEDVPSSSQNGTPIAQVRKYKTTVRESPRKK